MVVSTLNGKQISRLVNSGDEELQKVWSALGMNDLGSITTVFGLDEEGILTRSLF